MRLDLVLLPEMAFFPWFAQKKHLDSEIWNEAVRTHVQSLQLLQELSPACVLGTEPIITIEIDLGLADQAKKTYPRYVPD